MSRQLFFLGWLAAGILAAQDPPSRVGRLSYIAGSVSFQPAGVSEWAAATVNRPLTEGDQLWADAGARAEVRVPGTAFRLGAGTAFQFLNLDDNNIQVRLSEGTLDIGVRRLTGQNLEIDTPNLAFTIRRAGHYRIDSNANTLETYVTVREGEGEVTGNAGAFPVRMGEQAVVTGQDGSQFNVYAAPGPDEFDNWALSRDRREEQIQASRYVSPDVVGYEDLDEYGDWRSVPDYGQVWFPRVRAGWAPYQEGRWVWMDPWGWTWVDDAPWGFAPFHYGRWAFSGGRWGWAPGRAGLSAVYAPALVAWVGFGGGGIGVSFNFGGPAVGWFPLGPRDVYIPAYRASPAYVSRVNVTNTTVINNSYVTNVYNNYARTGQIGNVNYMNRTAPGAVIAMPRNALVSAQPVQQVAVRPQPNQITAIRRVDPAPRAAPQVVSVLGRPVAGRTPRPPAVAISRPVVARTAPPPAPVPFQQRQNLLGQNPGRPLPIQQQRQMARFAPAAVRPPVKVVAQARPVVPPVSNRPAPRFSAASRSVTPPAQAPVQQRPVQQPAAQVSRPTPSNQPSRPWQPPAAQQRQPLPAAQRQQPVQPNRPNPAAAQRQQPAAQPNQPQRPYAPPAVQQRREEASRAAQVNRPAASIPAQRAPQTSPPNQARRAPEPAAVNRPVRPSEPQTRQSRPAPPPSRLAAPAPDIRERSRMQAPERQVPRPSPRIAQPPPAPQRPPAPQAAPQKQDSRGERPQK